jgi:hypothetical protein
VLAAALAACASFGGTRPRFAPLPDAVVLETTIPVADVLAQVHDSALAAGFTIAVLAPREGYIETGWYDVASQHAVAPPYHHLDSTVRLRLFVDPVATHSRVVAECVRRARWDPSVPERELERMVPAGEPGRDLLDRLLVVMRGSVYRDTTQRR